MLINYTIYHSFLETTFPRVRVQLQGGVQPEPVLSIAEVPVLAATRVEALPQPQANPLARIWKKSRVWILNGAIAAAILVASFVLLPDIYYSIVPSDTEPIKALQEGSPLGGNFQDGPATTAAEARPLPPRDESLPEGEWLIIPKIGVRTPLQATTNPDDALATGVWMVPEYGRPGSLDKPMILAAHRFGWKWWWKDEYWKYHSFYLLTKLEPGDIVETISDKRKYYYEIYGGEEGEEITDYNADLILYTCKFLSSPLRHFRYARLVDIQKDTQGQAVSQR